MALFQQTAPKKKSLAEDMMSRLGDRGPFSRSLRDEMYRDSNPSPYMPSDNPTSLDTSEADTGQAIKRSLAADMGLGSPAYEPERPSTIVGHPPHQPSRVEQTESQLSALDAAPTRKQSFLRTALASAPLALGAIFGGTAGASGAAEGVGEYQDQQTALKNDQRKSLRAELEKQRDLETGTMERSLTRDMEAAKNAQQADQFNQTMGLQRETLAESMRKADLENGKPTIVPQGSMAVGRDGKTIATGLPAPRNIDPLSPQGIQARLDQLGRERDLPPARTNPIPGRDIPFPTSVAKQRSDIAAASRAPDNTLAQVQDPDGTVRWVPRALAVGKQAYKPTGVASEGERKAAGYFTRASAAEESLKQLEGKLGNMSLADQVILHNSPNTFQTQVGQQYNQAKSDFINATLRRESGAAIAPSEFIRFDQMYFPQIGDSKETVRLKAISRKTELDSIRKEADRALSQPAGTGSGGGKTLDESMARDFLNQARGDKDKARQLAKAAGYSWN